MAKEGLAGLALPLPGIRETFPGTLCRQGQPCPLAGKWLTLCFHSRQLYLPLAVYPRSAGAPLPPPPSPPVGAHRSGQPAWAARGRWKCFSSCSWGRQQILIVRSPSAEPLLQCVGNSWKGKGLQSPVCSLVGSSSVFAAEKTCGIFCAAGKSPIIAGRKPCWGVSQIFFLIYTVNKAIMVMQRVTGTVWSTASGKHWEFSYVFVGRTLGPMLRPSYIKSIPLVLW